MRAILIILALLAATKAHMEIPINRSSALEIVRRIARDTREQAREEFEEAMWLLKSLEGYQEKSEWDVNRYRYGYGTEAPGPYSRIDMEEADERAREILVSCYVDMIAKYPLLTQRACMALALMRYNVGSFGPNLHRACLSGNTAAIRTVMLRYVYSDGEFLQGLADRREREANFGGF